VTYVNGSYFGDSDCWPSVSHDLKTNLNLNDSDESASSEKETDVSKYFRDSTAEADNFNRVSVVMVIKKKHFEEEMKKFPQIYNFVRNVAFAKLDYHASLINIIVRKHQEEENIKALIKNRMINVRMTTHMSLKRILKKKKIREN
jgi:hypothetical protein